MLFRAMSVLRLLACCMVLARAGCLHAVEIPEEV